MRNWHSACEPAVQAVFDYFGHGFLGPDIGKDDDRDNEIQGRVDAHEAAEKLVESFASDHVSYRTTCAKICSHTNAHRFYQIMATPSHIGIFGPNIGSPELVRASHGLPLRIYPDLPKCPLVPE